MIINLRNKRYGITGQYEIAEDIWLKHTSMHNVRPEEALQSNLSIYYGRNIPVTSEMIEKVIEDEYRQYQDLPEMIMKAKMKYEMMQKSNIMHQGGQGIKWRGRRRFER